MATVALRRPGAVWARSIAGLKLADLTGIAALSALALVLHTGHLGTPFWIDEGLSVGIASHPLGDIPYLLRQDGSPPLYYMLLHLWISVFGNSETATHWLSEVFAVLCVPASWWAGRSLFGPRVGWTMAGLAALLPFFSTYAQETRMYSLAVLLGIGATACFVHAYVYGRQGYRIPFGVLLAALLYTHNWAYFFGTGLVAVLVLVWRRADAEQRRRLRRDAAVGFGTTAVLYAPWIPNFVYQTLHTGAPWATAPSVKGLLHAPNLLLGGQSGTVVIGLIAGAGLATLRAGTTRERRVLLPALVLLVLVPIVVAWTLSQVSPAWATRYLAVAVGPNLLLAGVGLSRAGRLGQAALVVLALLWAFYPSPDSKSNVHWLATTIGQQMHRGDLVISTQPEQVPVLHYYLPAGMTYATPFGVQRDTGVTDWRDGTGHFDDTDADHQLLPLLARLRVGQQVLFVKPIVLNAARWRAPWTSRIRDRTVEYDGLLRGDPRFELLQTIPQNYRNPGPIPLQGLLFVKTRA